MKKHFTFIAAVILFSLSLSAQTEEANLTGVIQDKSSKQSVEFATVQLLSGSDSAVIKTTLTDKKGKFLFDKISKGNYVLSCSLSVTKKH